MSNYIAKQITEFRGLPENADLEHLPCTSEELTTLSELLPGGHSLPSAVRDFLLFGGHKMGRLFNSVDFSYKMIMTFLTQGHGDILKMLVSEDAEAKIPDNILILNEYSGSSFTYILLGKGDDSAVYFWEEGAGGMGTAEIDAESFSAFLSQRIANYKRLLERNKVN